VPVPFERARTCTASQLIQRANTHQRTATDLRSPPPARACSFLAKVADACENLGVAYWRKTPLATADKQASNHGISAQKFQLIRVRGSRLQSVAWEWKRSRGGLTAIGRPEPSAVFNHRPS
jgi:hypothetical protein